MAFDTANDQRYKVHIGTTPGRLGTNIYIYESLPGNKVQVLQFGDMSMKTVGEGEEVAPSISIPLMEGRDILASLAKAINEQGIHTTTDEKIAAVQGRLDESRLHSSYLEGLVDKLLSKLS